MNRRSIKNIERYTDEKLETCIVLYRRSSYLVRFAPPRFASPRIVPPPSHKLWGFLYCNVAEPEANISTSPPPLLEAKILAPPLTGVSGLPKNNVLKFPKVSYHYLDHREGREIHWEGQELLSIMMGRFMKILKLKWGGSWSSMKHSFSRVTLKMFGATRHFYHISA